MLLLRLLGRLVGAVWTLVLALLALGVSIYCLDANNGVGLGHLRPDRLVGLAHVQGRVGSFLQQLAAPGPVASLSLLCGLGSILAGVVLLVAILRRPKERLAVMSDEGAAGTLASRRSTLKAMVAVLAERPHEVIAIKRPRLSLARRGAGGRLTVFAQRAPASGRPEVEGAIERALEPLTEAFSLKLRTRVKQGPGEQGR